jgi:hypothetical protein
VGGKKRQRRMLDVRVVALVGDTVCVGVCRVWVWYSVRGTTLQSCGKHSSVAWTSSTVDKGTDIRIVVELDRKACTPEDSDEYESSLAEG